MKLRIFGLVLLFTLPGCICGLAQGTVAGANAHSGMIELAAYHGGMVTPPLPKPSFVLTDTAGAPFDFAHNTRGYVTLLFFGYTHCTSICPTQMAYLAGAMRQMPKEVTDKIKVVFVTTDPARDNPHLLRNWLNNFNRSFIGLTGNESAVRAAQVAAKVPSGGDFTEHAAFVIAYTQDNLGHVIYPAGVTQADWMSDLPRLVQSWK